MGIDPLREKRWILLPGTLCSADIFNGLLDALEVEKIHRYPIILKHARPEEYLPELHEIMNSHLDTGTGSLTRPRPAPAPGRGLGPGTVVCGFSLGAIVAAHLADQLDVSAVVLFGLNPNADDPAKASARLALQEAVRTEGGRAALESRLPAILGPTPGQTREHILSMADDMAGFIGEQTTLALTRPGAMKALATARCPIRLLTGSEDRSAPFELAITAANAAADGQAQVLGGLGHYAVAEDPELCCATLKKMFDF